MGTKIVFLNLADMHEQGLAHDSVTALRRKYPAYSQIYEYLNGPNRVDLINLFAFLEEHLRPRRIGSLSDLTAAMPWFLERIRVMQLCSEADKIMLGAHGNADDRDRIFAGMGWGRGSGPVGTFRDFAHVVAGLLLPDRAYRIVLVVCHAARSERYTINHDGELTPQDIKSSFAYKFFKELITVSGARITMSARTGAMGFDAQSGRAQVQTEAAVSASLERAELERAEAPRIVKAWKDFEASVGQVCPSCGGVHSVTQEEGEAIVGRMLRPDAVPGNSIEKLVHDYFTLEARARVLVERSSEKRSKIGKFIYTYKEGTAHVYRKYEGGRTVMRPLYTGAL